MNFYDYLKQSYRSMRSHKTRTVFTMVGIFTGIMSIVIIVILSTSASDYFNDEMTKAGANVIQVVSVQNSSGDTAELTEEDMDLIRSYYNHMISEITGYTTLEGSVVINGTSQSAYTCGVDSDYVRFSDVKMLEGHYILDLDVSSSSKVCVINENLAIRLFGTTHCVGKNISFTDNSGFTNDYSIIGVTAVTDVFDEMVSDDAFSAFIYIPITTYQDIYSATSYNYFLIAANDKDTMKQLGLNIVTLLEQSNEVEEVYSVVSASDIQSLLNGLITALTMILLVVAFLTLFVAGVGVMNMELVIVTERKPEIGVRKALGARNSDIVFQFLLDSILLVSISGGLGTLFGIGIAYVLLSTLSVAISINIYLLLGVVAFFVVLGILFGVYPAYITTRILPIDCLKSE